MCQSLHKHFTCMSSLHPDTHPCEGHITDSPILQIRAPGTEKHSNLPQAKVNTLSSSMQRAWVPMCICAQSWLTLRLRGLQPTRLLCPWNSPGKNARVGCYFFLQGIFLIHGLNSHHLDLLHWQVGSLSLYHLESPYGYLCSIENAKMGKTQSLPSR